MSKPVPVVMSATPPPGAASEASSPESDGVCDHAVGPDPLATRPNTHAMNVAMAYVEYHSNWGNRAGRVAYAPSVCPEHPESELLAHKICKKCKKYH
jgi:hypothetical protein